MESFTFNGLHVETNGPQDAPAILFLHGGGAGAWTWHPVIERLSEFHCLAPDLPEHGGSAALKPFSIAEAAGRMAELIRNRIPGGRAHVVGLSEGAQVAVAMLASAPEVMASAVVSSALLRPLGWGWMLTPGLIRWSYRVSVPPFRNNDAWIRLNMKYAAGVPEAYFPQFKRDFQAMTEAGFTNVLLENQRFRLPQGLDKADLPVLALAGMKEYPAMRASALDLGKALPQATVRLVDLGKNATLASEHNWCLTAPERFAETVRAWVNRAALPDFLQPAA
ncbi:predicted hydrolase [Longilinea arvoryzae]|uniref:Predicted hydrolase n=1 Tax=Longilinea arvoryzae TaxID=360412 RepID=A0A0S7BMW7_9CHLR|nr:alpha/beta hydrolase [Longilinea arvoryzae]GAP15602.1 predicted hydrolase [Longilinea arvoryzae]